MAGLLQRYLFSRLENFAFASSVYACLSCGLEIFRSQANSSSSFFSYFFHSTTVTVVMLSLHLLVYLQLGGNKKKNVVIWVPPKAKPVLPFGLGPPAEIVKPEEYLQSTYAEHELKLLKESVQTIIMSTGMCLLMSFKFNVHVSLIIQAVSGPVGAIDSIILKKYILGIKKDNMYGEFLEAPTAEMLATLAGEEPRVVELKEDEDVKVVPEKSKSRACAEVSNADKLD